MSTNNQPATARIQAKKQTLEDAYSPPANFLEIDITDPQTHGLPKSKGRYTDYAVKMKVSGQKKNPFCHSLLSGSCLRVMDHCRSVSVVIPFPY